MADELKHIIQLIDDMRDNRVIEAAIRAHVQAAIDAALIDLTHDLGSLYIHRNGHELYNSAIDDVARFIKGQLGTNPLAEAQTKIKELNGLCLYHEGLERELQAKIAELERELAEARKACNVAGPEFNELYKDLKGF